MKLVRVGVTAGAIGVAEELQGRGPELPYPGEMRGEVIAVVTCEVLSLIFTDHSRAEDREGGPQAAVGQRLGTSLVSVPARTFRLLCTHPF